MKGEYEYAIRLGYEALGKLADYLSANPGKSIKIKAYTDNHGNDGDNNWLQPNRRPASCMAPSLVRKDGRVMLAIGGSGGPRIASSVALGILNVIADGMSLKEALTAPRLHPNRGARGDGRCSHGC